MQTEDRNYYNDARVRAAEETDDFTILEERAGTLVIRLDESIVEMLCDEGVRQREGREDDFDGVLEVEFKYEVCSLCEGRGKHVNPSIDCGGLTQEDFAEDPDFAEEYMSGNYDVPCACCHGKRVVPSVTLPEDVQKALDAWHQSLAESRRTEMYERMMGA
jgi:hypothetical protein